MLSPAIEHRQADEISAEIPTEGSAPLLVVAEGGAYYVKTTLSPPPRMELINEALVAGVARCWQLRVPEMALITIPPVVVENYLAQGNNLSDHYPAGWVGDAPFFASRKLENCVEVEAYLRGISKPEFKQFANPLDIIKNGLLDLWLGNRDRRPENPNLLLQETTDGFHFCPIDHAAAFGYCANFKSLKTSDLFLHPSQCILSTQLVRDLAKYASKAAVDALEATALAGMLATLTHLDAIFEQIPSAWGCSVKARARLREVLSDDARNQRIATAYRAYLT